MKITWFPVEGRKAAEPIRHEDADRATQPETTGGAPEQSRDTDETFCETPMSKKIAADHIKLKRAYEPPAPNDGTRILIDRLWPRGLRKADVAIDEWMKQIAPSTALRKWFGHQPERWPEFRRRYRSEIEQHPAEFDRLRSLAEHGQITLVFSAYDEEHNDAVVLKELLLSRPG